MRSSLELGSTQAEVWFTDTSEKCQRRVFYRCLQVLKLVEMGFDEAAAAAALSDANGDENLALEKLLGS